MILFNMKKKLKRLEFINSVDSNKIWSKELSIQEIDELLEKLKQELSKYNYKKDKDFFIDGRRSIMKRYVKEKEATEFHIKGSLFNFWEYVNNEYYGSSPDLVEKLKKSNFELSKIWDKYNKKGIICLQEKEDILEMINLIQDKISKLNKTNI